MKVAIVGSRNYPNLQEVERFIHSLARKYPEAMIISGGAPGVDITAEEVAYQLLMPVRSYRPKKSQRHYIILIKETGRFTISVRDDEAGRQMTFQSFKMAAYYRNGLIVSDADQVVAFQHQDSRGTGDAITKARAIGVPVTVYRPQ